MLERGVVTDLLTFSRREEEEEERKSSAVVMVSGSLGLGLGLKRWILYE